jgi:hypothetical protein
VGLGAVGGPRLAAGLLGLVGGLPLGEGGGLALAGPLLLFEEAGQPLDVGFQLGNAPLQRLAAGTGRFVHVGRIGKGTALSCAAGELPDAPDAWRR